MATLRVASPVNSPQALSTSNAVGLGRKLYNFAAFQVGWFACVLGGAAGRGWIGVAAVAVLMSIHLRIARERRGEWKLVALSIPIGLGVNTILQTTGAVVAGGSWTGPLWLLALWPLFASLFNESMSWMRGRYALGVAFGAVGAPLSYWAGESTGALQLGTRPLEWIPLVVVTWSIALIAMLRGQARFTPIRA